MARSRTFMTSILVTADDSFSGGGGEERRLEKRIRDEVQSNLESCGAETSAFTQCVEIRTAFDIAMEGFALMVANEADSSGDAIEDQRQLDILRDEARKLLRLE